MTPQRVTDRVIFNQHRAIFRKHTVHASTKLETAGTERTFERLERIEQFRLFQLEDRLRVVAEELLFILLREPFDFIDQEFHVIHRLAGRGIHR